MSALTDKLCEASRNGDLSAVKEFLTADPTLVNLRHSKTKQSPLIYAAMNKQKEVCSMLLDYGADINQRDNSATKYTALMRGSSSGCADTVRLLLSRGANIGIVDKTGETAIHKSKTSEIMHVLVKVLLYHQV
jgi:ankyrin repeat protein